MDTQQIGIPTTGAQTAAGEVEPSGAVVAHRERLPALDLLRFVAAVMVVVFHYTFRGAVNSEFTTTTYPAVDAVTRYGSYGVNLFFMISGFVILLTADAGGGRPAHFVASRISRLFPAFWVAMTITFLVALVAGASFAVGPIDYVLNLGMFPSWIAAPFVDGVYWTLEIELTFYVLIVFYLLFLRPRIRIEWLLVVWLLVVLPLIPNELGPTRIRNWLMVDAAPFFVAGCVCYLVWRTGWTRLRAGLFAASFVLAEAIAVRNAGTDTATLGTPFLPIATGAVVSIGFVVFLALVLHPSWFRFGGRWAIVLGALTYPLYLIHQNIGYLVINDVVPVVGSWLGLVVAFAVAVAIAWAIHQLVEERYNRRFRRWLEPHVGALDRVAENATAPRLDRAPVRHEP